MNTEKQTCTQKNEAQGTSRECFQMFSQPFVGYGSPSLQVFLCTITALICQAKSLRANETRKIGFSALELTRLKKHCTCFNHDLFIQHYENAIHTFLHTKLRKCIKDVKKFKI